ncbi:efflux RND transporter permease subunit [Desulfogranum mediterraneum]|uniref:efflux RND transporter permease subunit n=1 Tax=Desulfogranum mediterraneum TaxID=160661 RepID=UPI00041D66B6|nr:efflux RND transporter permease subunit [Desulfogranum mediterraneum]
MRKLLAAFAGNTVFANIVLLMIFMAGGLAVSTMLRESFPQFSLDLISIEVPYPGADPEEVEEGVSIKLEEALESVEGIKQFTTRSSENIASASLEVEDGYDITKVLNEVKSKVDAISTLPVDAEQPVITEVVMRESVTMLALSGELSEKQLKRWAEEVKDEVKLLPGISQVEVFGSREFEISIEVSEEKLQQYGLTFAQLSQAIRQSSLNLHGGTIRTQGEEIRVRTVGRKYTGEELGEIVVLTGENGELIRLNRIGYVRDHFTEDPVRALIDGVPSVFVMVFKTTQEDSVRISNSVADYVAEKELELPPGVSMVEFYDNTEILRARISLLSRNGIIGMGLVFFLLWLFLDLRLSFWGGLGIPISLAGGLFVLLLMGESINMISLFGFIMVLGIVVDDAIVVGEAIYVHRRSGKPALRAAVDGVDEVGMPVIAAILTSVVAFFPLSQVGGVMGKFIAILPAVVISCLLISLLECLFLLPAHLSHLPDMNRPRVYTNLFARLMVGFQEFMQEQLERFVDTRYMGFLEWVLRWRYFSLALAFSVLLLTLGLVQAGLVKFQVFPKIDGFVVTSTVEFPEGTPPERTLEALERIESAFVRVAERTPTSSGRPMIRKRLSLVGQTLSNTMGRVGPNLGSVQIILLGSEHRGVHSNDLLVAWEEEIGTIPGVKSLTFEGLSAGPGGAEIEVWLQGYDLARINAAAAELQQQLGTFAGVFQIRSDFSPGKNELRLRLKPHARALGLTVDDLARQVKSSFFGEEAFRLQRGRDDIRVKVRYSRDERTSFAGFEQMRIRTPGGGEVPLLSVAEVEAAAGYSTIIRTDGLRRVAVTAEVDANQANANEIFAELNRTFFPELMARYPGVKLSLQGAKKNERESFGSLKVTFPLAIVGIFVIVATIFRSYIQPIVILFTIPFGIIGAVFGHLLLGYDLSMMSIFGMVALTGVVVNDAIVLIERINENLAQGMDFFEAVKQGGRRRFRAIFLTTLSTVGGLAPLIMETDMQAKFLIPMAVSLAFGVAFATVLTLALIPSLLAIVNDIRRGLVRLRSGRWPLSREEVEPAASRRIDRGLSD